MTTLTIAVGSKNPAKIRAVKEAFCLAYPMKALIVQGIDAQSQVADQPLSDAETKQGALNRVQDAKAKYPGADFYVALEAGIDDSMTYAWMIIENNPVDEKNLIRGQSRSAGLELPQRVLEKVNQGKELGDVMDEEFSTTNVKQAGGAISLFTNGLITRSSVYQDAILLALAPFLHSERYKS